MIHYQRMGMCCAVCAVNACQRAAGLGVGWFFLWDPRHLPRMPTTRLGRPGVSVSKREW